MERVYVTGYYGMGNFGDDLFTEVAHGEAQRLWPGARVWIGGSGTGTTARWYQRMQMESASRWGSAARATEAVAAAAWADRVTIFGGSLLTGRGGRWRIHHHAAEKQRAAYEAVGVSVGPFASSGAEARARAFIERLQRVIVRDVDSMQRLAAWGIESSLGGDLAALRDMGDVARSQVDLGDQTRVALCPINYDGMELRRYCDLVARILRDSDREPEVRVCQLNVHRQVGDGRTCSQIATYLQDQGFSKVQILAHTANRPGELLAVLANSSLVIASRLHAAISSYLLGRPFVIDLYHPKCLAFAEDVGASARVAISDSSDDWRHAVRNAVSGARLGLSPEAYRQRAHDVYFGSDPA